MTARVQIVVEAKDASSGILRAITGQLGNMGGLIEELTSKNVSWGNVAERATTMVIGALKDAYKTTAEYTEQVRDLSLASGQGAEASSRFLQVLDDYQLTAEDAKTATRALTREGLAPTIDTIAEISKEYNSLNSVEEKNALIQKKLGRASQEWLNLLNQGPDKIRAMNEAVDSGLILTEKNIKAYEENRLAMDQWNDSIQALKISWGNGLIPVMTSAVDSLNATARAQEILGDKFNATVIGTKAWNDALAQAKAEQEQVRAATEESSRALDENKVSMEEAAAAAKATTQYYQGLISSIQSAQSETDRYTNTENDLLAKKKALNNEMAVAIKRYGANSQKVQDIQGDLNDLDKDLDANSKAHQKWAAQTVFSFAQARAAADGEITQGEGEVLIEMGKQLGLFDDKTAEAMRSVNKSFENVDVSDTKAAIKSVSDALYTLTGKTWVINIETNTSGVTLPTDPTVPSTSGPTCFVGGTKILMKNHSYVNIEDVCVGDEVMSYDTESGELVPSKVVETFTHSPSEMGSYYLHINNVCVTKEHLFYANKKWTEAGRLRVGDELLDEKLQPVTVARVHSVYKRVRTYNLHVDHKSHNYFANGVLVHNYKTQPAQATGGEVYAGSRYVVGESGAEPFIPSVDGRILGHAEAMHALALGGGNYFYGPVTIEAGSETGGDVMSIR